MKTPMLESLFNKVSGLEVCKFITKRLQNWCFPVNIAKFSRTLSQNTSGRLLLDDECWVPIKSKFLIKYFFENMN